MQTTFFMSSKLGSLGTASKKGGRYSSTMPAGGGQREGRGGGAGFTPHQGVHSSPAPSLGGRAGHCWWDLPSALVGMLRLQPWLHREASLGWHRVAAVAP